eukprot:1714408-Amphidinium_carterae.1
METDGEQPDDTMGATAQSISSGSASSLFASTIDGQTIVAMESLMWESLVSPQCSPLVMQQLRESELTTDYNRNGNSILKTFATCASTATLPRDNFIPTAAMNDTSVYLWFTWLTEAQYNDFKNTGTVPGYKDTRGDNVHKHH